MNSLVELTSVSESKFSLIIRLLKTICICPDNYSFSVLTSSKCFKMYSAFCRSVLSPEVNI